MKREFKRNALEILLLLSLCADAVGATASPAPEIDSETGEIFYLLEEGLTCTANAPGKPTVLTWKDKLEVFDEEIVIWGELCNDTLETLPRENLQLDVDASGNTLLFEGRRYVRFDDPPALCDEGIWCVVEAE